MKCLTGMCSTLLVLAIAALNLTGCAAGSAVMAIAPHLVGATTEAPTTGSDMAVIQLKTPVTGDDFVANVRTIADRLGYDIPDTRVKPDAQGRGVNGRFVLLMKRSSTGFSSAFSGKVSRSSVSLILEDDGKTIQVNAHATTNEKQEGGASSSARKVANEFKKELSQLFANNS